MGTVIVYLWIVIVSGSFQFTILSEILSTTIFYILKWRPFQSFEFVKIVVAFVFCSHKSFITG